MTPITLATNTPGTPIPLGHRPAGIAITPNGTTAYVTNAGSDSVTPITVATNTPGTPIPVGENPGEVAITPDGTTAYVANIDSDSVTPITLATNTPGTPIPVGDRPFGIAITPAPRTTPTSTQLSVTPPSPTAAGTQQTLTATVTPSTATGSVQFKDGTSTVGNPVTLTNGIASITTTLPAGGHSLTVVFTPSSPAAFTGSTSAPVSYLVYATATRTTLTAAPNPGFRGIPVFLFASVAPFTATGTVQFTDGSIPLGAPVPVFGGVARFSTSTLATGPHTLSAVFTPTNPLAFGPSASPPVPLTIRTFA